MPPVLAGGPELLWFWGLITLRLSNPQRPDAGSLEAKYNVAWSDFAHELVVGIDSII